MELKWKTCLKAALTVAALLFVIHYWGAFADFVGLAIGAAFPLIVGCVIAYIVNIVMSAFERMYPKTKRKIFTAIKRPLCMLLAYAAVILVVVLVVYMIIPELVECVQLLIDKLPGAIETAYNWLDARFDMSYLMSEGSSYIQNGNIDWQGIIEKAGSILMTGVGGAMGSIFSIVTSVFSLLVTLVVAIVFSIYLLLGKEQIGRQFTRLMESYLHARIAHRVQYVVKVVDSSFHSFIVGQCVEAVVLGCLCIIGMLIFNFPYATMIGCLVGFTALIPVAGAYIGAAVGAFMIFTVEPLQALFFVIFLVVLQQLEGNLIYPRVVGASIGLPGVWVLAAVTIGGGVLGVGGMLLGVPLAAAVYQLLRNDVARREKEGVQAGEKMKRLLDDEN
ncbi:MAG: AI-2E family transporter [Clostridia bacterium]|nr:AI-2E family transporter [Clostridia bacterium]